MSFNLYRFWQKLDDIINYLTLRVTNMTLFENQHDTQSDKHDTLVTQCDTVNDEHDTLETQRNISGHQHVTLRPQIANKQKMR